MEAPELWAVEEVAAPISERLRAHFAAGRPTDRADRPEWLFGTALRLTRQLAPATTPLQAAVEVHGLGQVYHIPLEFARAIRGAVKVCSRQTSSTVPLFSFSLRRQSCVSSLVDEAPYG